MTASKKYYLHRRLKGKVTVVSRKRTIYQDAGQELPPLSQKHISRLETEFGYATQLQIPYANI